MMLAAATAGADRLSTLRTPGLSHLGNGNATLHAGLVTPIPKCFPHCGR
jgi:hypothetical protein